MSEQSNSVMEPERADHSFRPVQWALVSAAVVAGAGGFWALARLDPLFRDAIAPWRTPEFVSVMKGITTFGEGWLLGVAALLMAWGAHRVGRRDLVRAGLVAVPALIASGLFSRVIKILVGRPRPRTLTDGMSEWAPSLSSAFNSFPSGHAASAFTMAAVMAAVLPSWRGAWYAAATVIAFSRVAVDAHFMSDVVAGGLLGWVTGRLAMGVANRRMGPREESGSA